MKQFIASADTPPLEAGITSSGMKPCLDTPRLDAGSIEGFISVFLLVLFTAGCASMIPKEVTDVVVKPMTDSIVVASAAVFHQKEGRWPKDVSEAGLTKQVSQASEGKNELDFQNTTFTENADGSLTINFSSSADHLRKIVLEAPNSSHSQYVGIYKNVAGSTYQISGTITIDPTITEF